MYKIISFCLIGCVLMACNRRPKSNSVFYINNGGEPNRLNPIGSTDGAASRVHDYIYESLLTQDDDTAEWKPLLATEWKVSEDKTSFKFKLREGVLWQDGSELTAGDVKFSFDLMFDDKYNTAALRPYFTGIKEVKIIDKYNVEFIAKDKNWQNFDIAASMDIYPKAFYTQDKEKSYFNKNLNGSGPYILKDYSRGNRILLERNKNWWGNNIENEKRWKFSKIVLRFVSDKNVSLEMFKKGSFDILGMDPETYLKKTDGEEWGKSIHKVKTKNKSPKGYNFIAWNLKHPILKDKRVRKALTMLVNRPLMIKKFQYNESVIAKGPVYPSSPYHNKNLKTVDFNPKQAFLELKKAGWRDTDGDKILDKIIDGKRRKFSITILDPSEGFLKYLTIFKEDARKVGVELNIKVIEWSSFIKLIDERKFDAIRMAWATVVDWNPIQIWHTDSFKGGSNFIGFSNKEADRLMTEAKFIHDRSERIKKLNRVEEIIVNEFPYVWFSYSKSIMYGYSDRVKREKDTYNYTIGTKYWSFKSKMKKDI